MEQPTGNVRLKLENLQQLAEVEGRLSNLNNEISIASKNLRILKGDSERATKEKIYQEGLLETANSQLNEKKSEATKLDENLLEKKAQLNQLLVEFSEHSTKMEAEKMAMKDREDKVSAKERELISRESSLMHDEDELDLEEVSFNKKVAKLKEVISTF